MLGFHKNPSNCCFNFVVSDNYSLYLEGFTIPHASSRILTGFFLDGKIPRNPRRPWRQVISVLKVQKKKRKKKESTVLNKGQNTGFTSIEFTVEFRRVGRALLPANASPSTHKCSYLISTFGMSIPTLCGIINFHCQKEMNNT